MMIGTDEIGTVSGMTIDDNGRGDAVGSIGQVGLALDVDADVSYWIGRSAWLFLFVAFSVSNFCC
jgi:hypothetical protein